LVARRNFPELWLPLIGVAIAALWPLTAYALSPLALPFLLLIAGAVVLGIRWPEYGLATAIALAPMGRAEISQPAEAGIGLPTHPIQYLVPLLIITVLAYSVLVRGIDRRALPAVTVGIGLMILSILISGLFALDPGRALSFLVIAGALIFVAVINTCRTRRQLLVVLAGVLAALLIAAVQGIVQHQIEDFTFFAPTGTSSVGRVQASFGQPDDYGGFLALLIPPAAAIAFSRSFPNPLRLLTAAAAATGTLALIYSYSRWSMVACAVGALIWLFLLRPKVAIVAAVALGIGALLFAPSDIKERFENTSGSDISMRQDVNKTALDIYAARPFTGVGVNNFQIAYGQQWGADTATQRRLYHNQQLLIPTAAPNMYVNTLAEQGILGITALLVFLALALWTAFGAARSRQPSVSAIGLAVGMAVCAVIVNSLSSVALQDVTILMLFSLVAIAGIAERAFSSSGN
jgi:O-antigen ligase